MQELGEGVEFLRVWSWAGLALWTQAGFTGHLDRPLELTALPPRKPRLGLL